MVVGCLSMFRFFTLALALIAAPTMAAPKLDTYPHMASRFVQPRDVTVYVPDACKATACGVLYMQDGQQLWDPSTTWNHQAWQVAETLDRLIADKSVPPVIVVGIANTDKRGREYLPQKVYDRLSPAARARLDSDWGGPPLSDAYLRFMVEELKPFIDSHYQNKTDAADTFIMGSSMGGLISLYAQAEYPRVFGASASLSMHWPLGNPFNGVTDSPADVAEVTRAFDAYLATTGLTPGQNRVYIDQGTQTLDAHYRAFNLAFMPMMEKRGWTDAIHFSSQVFPGADHSEQSWAARLDIPLKFLLSQRVAKSGTLIRMRQVPSQFVQPRDVQVWLPKDYDPAKRYKVVYMMDGQNVFDPSPWSHADWGVLDSLPGLIADRKVPPAIVVAIDNIPARTAEYMPQRIYDILPPDYQARVRAFEDGAVPNSDNFLKFLVTELKPMIDRTYATIPGPEGTAIMGSSSGGHIALYAQGEYPKVFGASASLSMPWLMASPAEDPAHIQADTAVLAAAWRVWLKRSGMTPGPNRIYSDQGTVGLDALFTPYEASIVPALRADGWTERDFDNEIINGAEHSEVFWRRRIAAPLVFLLSH